LLTFITLLAVGIQTITDHLYLQPAACDFRRSTGSDAAERSSLQTCVCVWLRSSGRRPTGSDLALPAPLSVTRPH